MKPPAPNPALARLADHLRAVQSRTGWEPTVKQLLALIHLGTSPDPAPEYSEVGRAIAATSKPAVTRTIDRLEAEGWARRVHHEGDRRKVRVAITPAGRGVLQRLATAGAKP